MSEGRWVEREMQANHGMWLVACQFCGRGSLVWRGKYRGYQCTVCNRTNEVRPSCIAVCPRCKRENAIYNPSRQRTVTCWNCGEKIAVSTEPL